MDSEEVELIERCKKGNADAQRRLYSRYSPLLFAVALRYSNTRHDAEDIAQDAWVKVFRYLKSFSENNSFEGWLRRIVVNTAITHYRRQKKHTYHVDIDEVYATPKDLEAFKETDYNKEEIEKAINALPKGYATVFKMYVIEGFKHKEIAETLGIDVNTSKSQLSRARRALQGTLINMARIAKKSDGNQ
jgi:RNA polymerase sigma-70 factor (ECF subfamily)